MNAQAPTKLIRAKLLITGTVQGVGFRPFVYRLASALGLTGSVCNSGGTVEIEAFGEESFINEFVTRLKVDAPPISRIVSLDVQIDNELSTPVPPAFQIKESVGTLCTSIEVPPDVATCADCLAELFSADDRRFQYPFLNCTNCGPRFTIIHALPYDRGETTMSCFPMCDSCADEYARPEDRRFHAQPNACANCGPALAFYEPGSNAEPPQFQPALNQSILEQTVACLRAGSIMAIKGLGGFHLACDATDEEVVQRLRARKNRPAKPLAVMVADFEMVKRYCFVSEQEKLILEGSSRPIVLLRKNGDTKHDDPIAPSVAPQTHFLGVMLPYTPLQYLLLREFGKPLVMTSGNISEEPIVAGNREALERLRTVADAFLFNNRDIRSRYDDSVTRVINGSETILRRARGYAPKPIDLPFRARVPVLAVGGHLKNTFCLIDDNKAYVSQHVGDLDMLESINNFKDTLASFLKLFRIAPELIATDLHPDYGSTRLVKNWLTKQESAPFDTSSIKQIIPVQHHFAHVVSCMVENNVSQPVIGVAFDGIGYGDDRRLWGGEFVICEYGRFKRVARLSNSRMPGGVRAIKEPWRMAVGYLQGCTGLADETVVQIISRLEKSFGASKVAQVKKLASSELSPETSSCGRLFDGVASLLGLCDIALYEGHAAVALESHAEQFSSAVFPPSYPFAICNSEDQLIEIETAALVKGVLSDLENSMESTAYIAARFHETIANLIARVCDHVRGHEDINLVCLSGGVFQNERLLQRSMNLLEQSGFNVYINHQVPANDGGISLGQAVVALAQSGMLDHSN